MKYEGGGEKRQEKRGGEKEAGERGAEWCIACAYVVLLCQLFSASAVPHTCMPTSGIGPGGADNFVEDGGGGNVYLHERGMANGDVQAGGVQHKTAAAKGETAVEKRRATTTAVRQSSYFAAVAAVALADVETGAAAEAMLML